ncbi:tautomerase family protein [Acinetobacter pittii]|uniref:tautomerase family protein n=1 Tax=Acinetobacter pittii TaxID=48296 RepID=UPI002DB667A7|nr:tautomerase family protein [Acinetobacter pittii]MEB7641995.1 tautomerase family protein [Acinetobacter pittii]
MSQVKIYANEQTIMQYRELLSHAIHQALIEELKYPVEKRFQRFISLKPGNFIYPSDRSQHYIIIELSMFAGRSPATKKQLIQTLFRNIHEQCRISPQDIEITIFETPKENWGIRGKNADELLLNYQVNV